MIDLTAELCCHIIYQVPGYVTFRIEVLFTTRRHILILYRCISKDYSQFLFYPAQWTYSNDLRLQYMSQ